MKRGNPRASTANTRTPKLLDLLKYSGLVFALVMTIGTLTGCQSVAGRISPAVVPVAMRGHVHGGQQPVAQSLIQLYAVGTTGVASAAQPLVTQPVYTDDTGNFSLTGLYTCPSADAPVYLTSTGGNNSPGLTGKPNAAIALMTMLGPCGNLTDATFVTINEVTTVGSIWPLSLYMTSPNHLGSAAGDSTFGSALAKVNEFVSTAMGTAPGTPTATTFFADTAKLYSLADALASCINSTGGSAGDGSWCGNLFSYATEAGGTAPTDTITAALHIAQNPTRHVSDIFALVPPASPFQPSLTEAPADWTLALSSVPTVPVISPGSGTYLSGQQITLTESAAGATIHYTTDGSKPTAASPVYSAALGLTNSETVSAIAVSGTLTSGIAKANLAVTAGHLVFNNVPTGATVGTALTPAPSVSIVDASGNVITTGDVAITLALSTNPGGATLSGTTTVVASGGTATFPSATLSAAGSGYVLSASGPGLGSAVSSSFNVTAPVLSLLLSSSSVKVGSTSIGTVNLGAPASSAGVTVALSSNAANLVSVSPATLTIAPGQSSATFTYMGTSAGSAVLSASATGYGSATGSVTVNPLHSYYVSNSGSDANSGSSAAQSWKTLAKLNSTKLVPGDAAYLQCGSTFREALTVGASGTAGLHIAYGPYGTCSGSNLPLISAANLLSGWTAEKVGSFTAYYAPVASAPAIVFEDNHRLPLQGSKSALTAGTGFYDSANGRVYIRSREDGNPTSHCVEASVRQSSISGYMTSYIDLTKIEADKGALNSITFGGNLTGVTLTGMVTNYAKQNGVYFTVNTGESQTNLLIQNGTANFNGGDGVSKGNGGNNVVISGYVANYNAFDPANTFSGGIRIVSDGTTDANRPTYSGIQNSSADFNGVNPDTGAQVSDTTGSGVGVWCDTCGNGSFVANNEGHGNTQAGAQLEWTGAIGSQSMTGNVEWNNFYGILHARRSRNDLIANNTTWDNFINCRFSGDGDTTVGMVNNTYANNICGSQVWNGSGSVVQAINGAENNSLGEGYGNVFSNNSFGDPSATNGVFAVFGAGHNLKNYVQLDAAYGSSTNSITKDPMLNNPSAADFRLKAGSPAIRAGLWGKDLGAIPFGSTP